MIVAPSLFALCGVQTVVLLAYMAWVASPARFDGGEREEPAGEDLKKHILWKSFYANPRDPRGWVPKAWGYGTTPNFRTRGRALVFAGMIVADLLFALGGVAAVLTAS